MLVMLNIDCLLETDDSLYLPCSTVGNALARSLDRAFLDADAYHPQINIGASTEREGSNAWPSVLHNLTVYFPHVDKMRAGIPLTDADRWPWLDILANVIDQHLSAGQSLVLGCSALKESYRQKLRGRHSNATLFVSSR